MSGLGIVHESIQQLEPENNSFTAISGKRYTYDWLIASPGIQLRYDLIEGAQDALDDPTSPVGSIYKLPYAYKTSRLREEFKGGKALFTMPRMPIKCGGAPQKIMYLSEETFRKNNVRNQSEVHWYTTIDKMFGNS
jgi:sulfide:quinone oxidoreductase